MNKVAAFALRRKNSILSMSEKMFCPPQPLRFWITPAYAGKRSTGHIQPPGFRDHPRVCGEKSRSKLSSVMIQGSPPRMRGKVSAGKILLHDGGITPACAGKRCSARTPTFRTWDHPRVCGEKMPVCETVAWTWGSPPRMRGKVREAVMRGEIPGITPACAGKRR